MSDGPIYLIEDEHVTKHPGTEWESRAPRCPALHPVNSRRCEHQGGHPWDHAYTDERLREASRVWWNTTHGTMRDLDEVEAEVETQRQTTLFPGGTR